MTDGWLLSLDKGKPVEKAGTQSHRAFLNIEWQPGRRSGEK